MPGRSNIRSPDHPYHITARCNNREKFPLPLNEVWEIFEHQLFFIHHAFGIRIHAFVMMNNHYHLLASDPQLQLSHAMRWFMTETSREIGRRSNRKNHIYGQRNFKCLITSEHYFLHAYKYIYRNPVEAGACKKVEDYPYSTLFSLLGKSQLVVPIDDQILLSNLEVNLNWLNEFVEQENWDAVRCALKKDEFKLRKDRFRNKQLTLEQDRL
jgi:REP element-mobilizing transposase RayT